MKEKERKRERLRGTRTNVISPSNDLDPMGNHGGAALVLIAGGTLLELQPGVGCADISNISHPKDEAWTTMF
jgi:hypothetical protein